MTVSSTNPLMQGVLGKLAVHSAAKIPVMDRHHYSSSGGDYHSSYGGGYSHGGSQKGSHSIALSALTLLAFLFFLNILQNCLQEHMDSMNPQQVVVVTRLAAAREAEKRKGDDGILANITADDVVGEVELESRFGEEKVEGSKGQQESVEDDKYFVQLASREPEKEKGPWY